MILNSHTLNPDTKLEADYCIVGAGPAGIITALELSNAGYSVILLEAGGMEFSEASQYEYKGHTDIISEKSVRPVPDYLSQHRLRYLGGTSGHWAGFCRPLDRIDFEKRNWVSDSGWPIDYADFSKYFSRAAKYLEVPNFNQSGDSSILQPESQLLNSSDFVTREYHFSRPVRFGQHYREALSNHKKIKVLLNACLTEIHFEDDDTSINNIIFQTPELTKYQVHAKNFILASGAIENARLLLISKNIRSINNNIGKYFMEHAEYNSAYNLILNKTSTFLKNYQYRRTLLFGADASYPYMSIIAPTKQLQKEQRLLNSSIQIQISPDNNTHIYYKKRASIVDHLSAYGVKSNKPTVCRTYIRSEIPPLRSSMVNLDPDNYDRYSLPKATLKYILPDSVAESIHKTGKNFAIALGSEGLGSLRDIFEDASSLKKLKFGSHQMGTTRMSSNARNGVVDNNCKVWGLNNLYIAGSSVFPTAGYANPTFNIAALAVRLADHLKTLS